MSTTSGPIAKPKKGAALASGYRVKRGVDSGGFVAATADTPKSPKVLLNQVTGVPSGDRSKMLINIRQGLPFSVIETLEQEYGAPRKELADVLSIAISTLTRRKKEGRLHPDESDRVARLARIKDASVAMMQGNDEAAVEWLHSPQELLGNETPMEHISTEMGARDVEDLIGRIRHGVFS
ncbi:MAG: antitoxin Xre/MbcA/ParS toxin-binding domain-containing protein [Motiliproteus sp.]